MTRPTKTITLSDKTIVTLYTYLTISELRQIRRLIFKETKFNLNGKLENNDFTASIALDIEDLSLKTLVVDVQTQEGEKLTGEQAVSFLQNLTVDCGQQLYNEVNEIYKNSEHAPEVKKN